MRPRVTKQCEAYQYDQRSEITMIYRMNQIIFSWPEHSAYVKRVNSQSRPFLWVYGDTQGQCESVNKAVKEIKRRMFLK